ncbi:2Fe-2S iron-sulfur cluster binding domain-containing protein [candidate division KSB1 bacterium]|nr:2Fe-2S iron-sulfur cluster binding domain-containing protein [candidate division KSB1 bacterium]NIR70953.1 2Fe-2S iron-sulfur cluster binding domain-containing protein [candidate division KSB1 bacterium]NIS24689.1 2Fe-2S iron-sulfur cluster binding domain-containing protein [candidate division KSB1 bacterium]NIT71598.1 2Fe-2S iron-sulfur cluster binding domain-containing protein [candidate division KSB1 bacterium]NIU25302.1 2Fe-2S iron-sulfur cluster binding domain-containing protein [candid
MSDESNKKQMSRRTFLKGMGAGVVGTPLVISNLEAITPKQLQAEEDMDVKKQPISLKVNGKKVRVAVEPRASLAELLRNDLKLTGTKVVCNHGECGNCTVLLDGKAVYACHMLALDAAGRDVTTIEGLLSGEELHPVQKAFWEKDGLQCGFCTPGQIMAAHALLLKHPNPTREQILKEMSGNICRCAAYPKILESVMTAAEGSTS